MLERLIELIRVFHQLIDRLAELEPPKPAREEIRQVLPGPAGEAISGANGHGADVAVGGSARPLVSLEAPATPAEASLPGKKRGRPPKQAITTPSETDSKNPSL